MSLKLRVFLLIAALWVALSIFHSVRGTLTVLNPSSTALIHPSSISIDEAVINPSNKSVGASFHSHYDNQESSLIQSRTIIWSKNWYHHVSCPSVPQQFYERKTGHTARKGILISYFRTCTGIIWLSVGNPDGYDRPKMNLTPQREKNDVQYFIQFVLPLMNSTFTVVSTDGDHSMPYSALSAQTLLDHPLCQGWYTQNYDAHIEHPKMHPIPIGFDLHTKWPGLWSHTNVSVNIHHMLELRREGMTTARHNTTQLLVPYFRMRPNRERAAQALNCVRSDNTSLPLLRLEQMGLDMLWQNYTRYRFGLSPPGAGLDAHRTWEMLFFGMIPIVVSSAMDPLFDGLPVLIVRDFGEMCTPGFFEASWQRLKPLWPAPDHVFTTDWWLRNVTHSTLVIRH